MAPVQSRQARGSLGLGLVACGGVAATTLFVAPSAPPRAGSLDAPAVTPASSSVARPWATAACEGLAFAAVGGIVALRRSARGEQATALAATATAEAPPPPPPPFDPAGQVGAVAPLGFFDPLGFTKVGDEAGFRTLREAELKHGRVAMMASIGLLFQHYVKLPGFEKAPSGFAALGSGEGVLGMVALFAASGMLELAWRQDPSREPGNFGDPFGVNMYTEEMRAKEISNGRMAMISVLGIFAAELATGKDAIQQFGLSATGGRPTAQSSRVAAFAGRSRQYQTSSLVPRAASFNPADQLGAVEPLGYFDPMGFTKVGDRDGFWKLRDAEIKHGRVAMMAAVGLLAQHFVKFPGFEAAPSGLGALASDEGKFGLLCLFVASGIFELGAGRSDPSREREPGNFGDPAGLNQYTEEMRTKEISNGRMAMLSVLGIFAAELATGKDAVQQFGL